MRSSPARRSLGVGAPGGRPRGCFLGDVRVGEGMLRGDILLTAAPERRKKQADNYPHGRCLGAHFQRVGANISVNAQFLCPFRHRVRRAGR